MRNKLKIFGLIVGLILVAVLIKFIFYKPREIMFENAKVYGEVKSIKEISYKAQVKNNEVVKFKRWRRGHLTDDFHCFFNKEGLPIKKVFYPAADTGATSRTYLYKYDQKGQLINFYNEAKNPTKPSYFYNQKGQLIQEKTSLNIIRYDYYPDGNLYHKIQVDPKIGDEFIHTYTYENNFLKYLDVYYTVADWHIIDVFERDASGNIVKYKSVSSFDELKKEKWDEFEYEFDNYNNWIKCVHIRNKKPIYIIEREIEYY